MKKTRRSHHMGNISILGIYGSFDLWTFIYCPRLITLRENCTYWEFSGPYFPYLVRMRKNMDQKNSEYEHFLRNKRTSHPKTQLTTNLKLCESLL